jgi:hypothetical protein
MRVGGPLLKDFIEDYGRGCGNVEYIIVSVCGYSHHEIAGLNFPVA